MTTICDVSIHVFISYVPLPSLSDLTVYFVNISYSSKPSLKIQMQYACVYCTQGTFDFLCHVWNFLSACVGTFFCSKAFPLAVTSMKGRSFQNNSNSENGALSCYNVKFPYVLLLACFKYVFTRWMTKCIFKMCISNV